jgi:MarR family transcriptional regulator, 2-MHQ and catechol-resistance regulon repressor
LRVHGAITFTLNRLVVELNHRADRILRREFQMTYSQFLYLVQVAEHQPIEMTSLAGKLGISRAAISQRTPWFESRHLVRRESNPEHDRRVRLTLTPSGVALAENAGRTLEVRFRAGFSSLNRHHNLDELNTTLEAILTQLKKGPDP